MTAAARSPGKIILSGEHSVVYGAPALVAAIARYTTVRFFPIHQSASLRTALSGITAGRRLPIAALEHLRDVLDERFDAFKKGLLPVKNILQRPDDLVLYTLSQLAKQLPVPGRTNARGLPMPGHLHTKSEIPLGAGMGSSAAVIAATIVLYEYLLNKPQTLDKRFERVRFCERLQHGNGSAIDAAAVTYGGIRYLHHAEIAAVDATLPHWYWALTGIPESSTGECVSAVREKFSRDEALWQAFHDTTDMLCAQVKSHASPKTAIAENAALLRRIGVVPEATQQFIDQVVAAGGAAKTSGAGSIRGDNGGIVVIWHPDEAALARFMAQHYPELTWGKLEIATRGAELLPEESE